MQVDLEKCIGCGTCVRDCPTGAVRLVRKKAVISEACTECEGEEEKQCIVSCPVDCIVPIE